MGMKKSVFVACFSFLPLSLSFVEIRRLVKFFAEKVEKRYRKAAGKKTPSP